MGVLLVFLFGFGITTVIMGSIEQFRSDAWVVEFVMLKYKTREAQSLPSYVDQAITAGWHGTIRCLPGRGRFYRKLVDDESDPLMLLFDTNDRLLGLNFHSDAEQPAPWRYIPNGLESGVNGRETDYWDLNIFIGKSTDACETELRWRAR